MDLNGRTAIVTGAGSGIGRGLAVEFAHAGANVVCCGRTEQKIRETVGMIEKEGGTAHAVKADVTDSAQVQKMVNTTLKRFGHIDLLFNNAGSFKYVGPVWEADPDIWWKDVTINLLGSMLCCRKVLPHMMKKDAGIIINMDGGGGSNGPNPGGSAYGCSKAAILRFTEGLARELEDVGSAVLVFCMMPGFVRTSITKYLIGTPEREKWQPHVRELMGSDAELPADACAKATMKLLRIVSPELNGRIFYVDTDYNRIEKNKHKIRKEDLYTMHLLTLDGKLGPWPVVGK
ncbi:MAG: SDR family oxidoreductase [Spirochaetota bacterium]|nr:MAG: SDR family oxidoreductase [Spirochaetota bacterium]